MQILSFLKVHNNSKSFVSEALLKMLLYNLQRQIYLLPFKLIMCTHYFMIKLTSCSPMVGGSLRVLRLLPPLKLVALILLKVALNIKKSNQIKQTHYFIYSSIRENIHDTELNYQSFILIQIYVTEWGGFSTE